MEELFNDSYYMKLAIAQARLAAEMDEVPVGAVIVSHGRVIAKTHNMTERLNDVSSHAEMLAITAAENEFGGKYLKECTMYVTVEPCTMCAGAIGWAQLGRLVYGADDKKRGYTIIAPNALHPKTEVVKGIEAEECSVLMRNYFKGKR